MNDNDEVAAAVNAQRGTEVTLQRFKYGAIPHYRHVGTILGADELGTWLSLPPQPLMRAGEQVFDVTWWTLQLVPARDDGWWAAFFEDGVGNYDTYVDVCTDSMWAGTAASMIDLDLDVVRYRADGSVAVIDYDDLEHHTVALGYPAELVELVHATAERLRGALVGGRSPFDGSAEPWMELLRRDRRS
ncbi:MAG: DUF402 domain-containing protein [Acidimicrobiia bacterium]|nr:DUF402 domain-containing protein [Acidimicrobiia bacterium]